MYASRGPGCALGLEVAARMARNTKNLHHTSYRHSTVKFMRRTILFGNDCIGPICVNSRYRSPYVSLHMRTNELQVHFSTAKRLSNGNVRSHGWAREREEKKKKIKRTTSCVPDSLYRGKTQEWRRDCGWTLLSTWCWKNDRYRRRRRRCVVVVAVVVVKSDLSKILLLERERAVMVLLARKKPAGLRRATR